jgi:hypothetical protein
MAAKNKVFQQQKFTNNENNLWYVCMWKIIQRLNEYDVLAEIFTVFFKPSTDLRRLGFKFS